MRFTISKSKTLAKVLSKKSKSNLTQLGKVKFLTRGTPDGRWLDGNSGTNPRRWKK